MSLLRDCDLIAFIPADNLARARDFYKHVLGLSLVAEDSVALIFDANGTTLRIFSLQGIRPVPYTVLGWMVPDIELVVDELDRSGVEFQRYEGFEQDPRGIWTTPDGAKMAWFKDPYGNILSLTQI